MGYCGTGQLPGAIGCDASVSPGYDRTLTLNLTSSTSSGLTSTGLADRTLWSAGNVECTAWLCGATDVLACLPFPIHTSCPVANLPLLATPTSPRPCPSNALSDSKGSTDGEQEDERRTNQGEEHSKESTEAGPQGHATRTC